jgi:hypothetical protein
VDSRYEIMRQNCVLAEKRRIKPLDPKYLACSHLPSPYDERDLTSFITKWRETSDDDMLNSVKNC